MRAHIVIHQDHDGPPSGRIVAAFASKSAAETFVRDATAHLEAKAAAYWAAVKDEDGADERLAALDWSNPFDPAIASAADYAGVGMAGYRVVEVTVR